MFQASMISERPTHQPQEAKGVFVDLFAGCGGLSLGLMNAGWKGLFAVEKDSFAFETLKTNLIGADGNRALSIKKSSPNSTTYALHGITLTGVLRALLISAIRNLKWALLRILTLQRRRGQRRRNTLQRSRLLHLIPLFLLPTPGRNSERTWISTFGSWLNPSFLQFAVSRN